MSYTNQGLLNLLSPVISIVPRHYVNALLMLHEKIGDKAKWVISGDLAECLRTVQVEPDCIEIVTNQAGAQVIFMAVEECWPRQVLLKDHKLPRNAIIEGKEYPVYTRSYYFDFYLEGVKVKVHGDLRFKVGDWDWGDVFEFTPEYAYVVGKKTAVTPLSIAAELYQYLGWNDRLERIQRVTKRPQMLKVKPS